MHRTQKLLHRDYKSIKDVILLESAFAETTKCGLGIRQVYLALSARNLFIAVDDVGRACSASGGKETNYNTTGFSGGNTRNYTALGATGGHERNRISSAQKGSCASVAPSVRGKNYASSAPSVREKNNSVVWSKEKRTIRSEPRGINVSDPVDPLIESLRLVSLFPLDCVCLHVYRERTRNTIKLYAQQDHTRARYFELGGCGYHGNRAMLWSLWQERIKSLTSSRTAPPLDNTLSIHSDTSVGTSVTKSTLPVYMLARFRLRTLDTGCAKEEVLCDIGHIHYVDSVGGKSWQTSSEFHRLVEESVTIWEHTRYSDSPRVKSQYKKCIPWPHFCYGLGTTHARRQEKHLLFVRKTKSLLSIPRREREAEFPDPVSRKQLTGTVSQLTISHPVRESKSPSFVFWTAQCSRMTPPRASYHEALRLRTAWSHETQGKKGKTSGLWRKFKHMTTMSKTKLSTGVEEDRNPPGVSNAKTIVKLSPSIQNIQASYTIARHRLPPDNTELFRIRHNMNISDCDVDAVASQLTLLEGSLLSAIPVQELVLLANEKTTDNTPRIRHSLAFSQRVSGLVSTEIISTKESVPLRAKILAKFILIAHECCKLHNYQSTLSILHGLQSPPVQRLAQTWSYVRKYHGRKYRLYSRMITNLHDPVDVGFVRTMSETIGSSRHFILPLRYILATLVNRLPHGSAHVCNAHALGTKYTTRVRQTIQNTTRYNAHERNHSNTRSRDKPSLAIANYKNITNAIELLVLCGNAMQGYVDTIESNDTQEYLTKKHYREDMVNFVLSKKLE